MGQTIDQFVNGQRVKVTQQIPQVTETWTNTIIGTVQKYERQKTGSWFAHSKDDKLWLDRLILKLDDGEIVTCNLDQYTHVEVLEAEAGIEVLVECVRHEYGADDLVLVELYGTDCMRRDCNQEAEN